MSAEGPEAGPRRRSLAESWPLLAAGAAILATLAAVYALLHPRGSGVARPAAENAPAAVTADRAELRTEPSAGSALVAVLAGGAKLRIGTQAGRWVEAETGTGERGYLPAESVEADSDRDARQRRAKTLLALAPVSGVVSEDTDVALAPYPLAPRGGRLARGTVIAIHSVDHSYFAFADPKWGIAFVSSASVDLMPQDPGKPAIEPEKVKRLKDLTVIDVECPPSPEPEAPAAEGSPQAGSAGPPEAVVASQPAVGLLEPPALISRVEPAYPDSARRAGVEGTVELELAIDAQGKVTDVEVVRGLALGLSEAAAEAARRWSFRPARSAGRPVASRTIVRIRFVLGGDGR